MLFCFPNKNSMFLTYERKSVNYVVMLFGIQFSKSKFKKNLYSDKN